MEYLHGESLGRLLNAVAGERVPLAHVVTIVLGVAAGLHCAHERRGVDGRTLDIVHRDLSPGNVFITYEGGVKLLDFGIAKATSRTSITVGPARKGKVSYMSPEQCVGAEVDRRTDIFALGVVAWELCTGKRLFVGDNEFAIMNQVTTVDAPSPTRHVADLSAAFADIILRALRRDPAARFQSAMELHDAVEAFALAHGVLPSSAALGRYLADACGWREYPSVEATEEFREPGGSTLVVPGTATAVPRSRRGTVLLAIVGGALLGATGVAAATSRAVEPAPVVDSPVAAPVVEPEPAVAAPRPAPVAVQPSAGAANVVAPALADRPRETPPTARRRIGRGKRSPARRAAEPAKPPPSDKPVHGVDGLFPRD